MGNAIIAPDIQSPATLKEFRADTYQAILNSFAEGTPAYKIAKMINVPLRLIREVAQAENVYITAKRETVIKLHESIAAKAAHRVLETVDECTAKEAAIIGGISIDKLAMLKGEPGQIIEHRITADPTPLANIIEASATVSDVPQDAKQLNESSEG